MVKNVYSFGYCPISYKNFQNSGRLYLCQMTAGEATFAPQWDPRTHDDAHETGAARKAEQSLFVQRNHFRNYQKPLDF